MTGLGVQRNKNVELGSACQVNKADFDTNTLVILLCCKMKVRAGLQISFNVLYILMYKLTHVYVELKKYFTKSVQNYNFTKLIAC